jgi:hypothetical protein
MTALSFEKEPALRKPTKAERLSAKLVRQGYDDNIRDNAPTHRELLDFQRFADKHNLQGSEGWFLPEKNEYQIVLNRICKNDVILDIGAGNLALDIILAEQCKKVYAIECNPFILSEALKTIGYDLPRNLIVICANGLDVPIPCDVNTLVMLLRHFSQTLPEKYLEIPKIIAQIYGTWIIVPEQTEVSK